MSLFDSELVNQVLWLPHVDDSSLTLVDPVTGAVVDTVLVPGSAQTMLPPRDILALSGSVWVTNPADHTVAVIDATSHEVVDIISVGVEPGELASVDGTIFVLNQRDGSLDVIDPQSHGVVATIPTGTIPIGLFVDDEMIWVTGNRLNADNSYTQVLTIVAPHEYSVISTIEGVAGPAAIAIGDEEWILSFPSDSPGSPEQSFAVTIDRRSMSIVDSVPVSPWSSYMEFIDGLLWVTGGDHGEPLTVIDPGSRVVTTITVSGVPGRAVGHGGLVWMPLLGSQIVVAIDPMTFEVVQQMDIGVQTGDLLVAGDSLWSLDVSTGTLTEIVA